MDNYAVLVYVGNITIIQRSPSTSEGWRPSLASEGPCGTQYMDKLLFSSNLETLRHTVPFSVFQCQCPMVLYIPECLWYTEY